MPSLPRAGSMHAMKNIPISKVFKRSSVPVLNMSNNKCFLRIVPFVDLEENFERLRSVIDHWSWERREDGGWRI